MTGYTKLFGSIIASTIWSESKETKIVWITMLAMANRKGIVEASVPGLAKMAGVTVPECESALACLSSPDPYSRTKEHEGRRIEVADGGWLILNHAKYRKKMRGEERTEYLRIKQQEHRAKAKKKRVNKLSTCQPLSTTVNPRTPIAEAEAEAEALVQNRSASPVDIKVVFDAWNEQKALPQCLLISSKRQGYLEARLNDPFFAKNWREALTRVSQSQFCLGQNERGWKANFDWFIRPDTCAKIMEGQYGNSNRIQNTRPNHRNDGIAKGTTDYGSAKPRLQREREAAALAKQVDSNGGNSQSGSQSQASLI